MVHTISAPELYQWMQKDNSFCLVDVREKEEFQAGYIEGAQLLPLHQVHQAQLPERPVVLYCRSGKRSDMAGQLLSAQYPNGEFYNLEGGILAWQASKLPLLQSENLP